MFKIRQVSPAEFPARYRAIGPRKYPFHEMKVGDGFDVPDGVSVAAMRFAASRHSTRHGVRLRVLRRSDGGYTVWRTE